MFQYNFIYKNRQLARVGPQATFCQSPIYLAIQFYGTYTCMKKIQYGCILEFPLTLFLKLQYAKFQKDMK